MSALFHQHPPSLELGHPATLQLLVRRRLLWLCRLAFDFKSKACVVAMSVLSVIPFDARFWSGGAIGGALVGIVVLAIVGYFLWTRCISKQKTGVRATVFDLGLCSF